MQIGSVQQDCEILRLKIHAGELSPGEKLYSTRALASDLGVSRYCGPRLRTTRIQGVYRNSTRFIFLRGFNSEVHNSTELEKEASHL